MKLEGEGQMLRVFLDESDKYEGRPLYAVLVTRARAEGLCGATVLRGVMGYGCNGLIHAPATDAHLPEDLPVVVEIVDTAERIRAFTPIVERMVKEGLITTEKVGVICRRSSRAAV